MRSSRRATRIWAEVIDALRASPNWADMLIIVTADENGGYWDHVAPPKIDRFGPGARVPTLIISPFARKGFVDKTVYDTTSILRTIEARFGLAPLARARRSGSAQRADLAPRAGVLRSNQANGQIADSPSGGGSKGELPVCRTVARFRVNSGIPLQKQKSIGRSTKAWRGSHLEDFALRVVILPTHWGCYYYSIDSFELYQGILSLCE